MLKQIQSKVFRKNPICFHEGLNAVLGDEQGSNSIGKSTLLMIIDFAFGGGSYIEKNRDTVRNLGHHCFEFTLQFDGKLYYFRRGTECYKEVEVCDSNFNKIDIWDIKEYTSFLHKSYIKENEIIKFRGCVGVFSRIAQKENYFNSKPLKVVINSKEVEGINTLIKLFNRYKIIEDIEKEIKGLNKKIDTVNAADRHKYIKKPTDKQYEANKEYIKKNLQKLNKIAIQLSFNLNTFFDTNYQESQNQLYELKNEKQALISKLKRINKNIQSSTEVKAKSFEPLQQYFEGVNVEKLSKIIEFHKGLNSILIDEFYRAKTDVEKKIEEIEQQVQVIEQQVIHKNTQQSIPQVLMEPLVELITQVNERKQANTIYDEYMLNKKNKEEKEKKLIENKQDILLSITNKINDKMKELNDYIYGEDNKAPRFKATEKEYFLTLPDNTGTARGYANLIIFDISILKLTILPFIIHDSVLFKNIGNVPMAKIIEVYNSEIKQSFIAIDEVGKFTIECQEILNDKHVIKLSDESTLFIKDWTKE